MAEDTTKESPVKSGFDMKILLVGLLIFLVAMGGSYFLMRSLMAPLYPKTEDKDSTETKEVASGSLISVGEFTTNIGGYEGNHLVKVEVFVEIPEKKDQESMEELMPIVKDTILGVLSSKTVADLEVGNRENIKQEIKKKINANLGGNTVNSVYFTNFILQ